MKRLTLLFGALLAAALCTLPAADAAAQPKPTKYNLCRKHPADGPYIVYDAEKGAYAATADKRGRVRVMPYGGGPVEVRSSRGAYLFSVTPHAVERGPRELPQAPKLFVTSDLHGDFRSFATLLQAHGVIDGDCRWSYGNNQLAVIGDIFDRGYDVLLLTQDVDEFTFQAMREYVAADMPKIYEDDAAREAAEKAVADGAEPEVEDRHLELKNVATGDLDLATEDEKKEAEDATKENEDLFNAMKEALGDKVEKVAVSARLTDAPACITTEGPLSLEMEKVLQKGPEGAPDGMPKSCLLYTSDAADE